MAFDKDKPASTTSLRNSNPEILANWSALEDAINREHSFSTGGTVAAQGQHTQGSAKAFSQATAPATQVDGGAFAATDLGSIWVDTDDNAVYVLTATTPTWTPVSAEIIATLLAANRIFGGTLGVTGDFDVNTDKFNVTAASGNTTVAGTLGVTGATTLTGGLNATTMAGALAMGSNKITGMADGTASGDGIHKGQYKVDDVAAASMGAASSSVTLPNGLIMKFGSEAVGAGATDTVTFADTSVAFDNDCLFVFLTHTSLTAGTLHSASAHTLTATTFKLFNSSTTATWNWFAIGF